MRLCSWFITYLAILGGACLTLEAAPTVIYPPTTTANQSFGRNIIGTSDFSGDGKPDLYVSAAGINQVFVINPLTGAIIHTLGSPNSKTSGLFGNSMALMPDANGDGLDDILIGAASEDTPAANSAGRAYLYTSNNFSTPRLSMTAPNSVSSSNFGAAITSVPDMDGDQRDDIMISAPDETVNGSTKAGMLYIFSGADGTLVTNISQPTIAANNRFGAILKRTSDLSGDHIDEILMVSNKTVYVFNPVTRTFIGTITRTANISSLLTLPDANGDGRDDLLIGTPFETVQSSLGVGTVALYSGATFVLIRSFLPPVPMANALFGSSLADVGDRSGDGQDDFLIGAVYQKDISAVESGAAFIINGVTGALIQSLYSPAPILNGLFGFGSAVINDLNGDGKAEVVVSALAELNNSVKTGRVYLYSSTEPLGGDPVQVYDFNESSLDLSRWSVVSGTQPTLVNGKLRIENGVIATTQLLGGQPVVVEMTGVSYASIPSETADFNIGLRYPAGAATSSPVVIDGLWYEFFSHPTSNGSLSLLLGSYPGLPPSTPFDLTLIISGNRIDFFKNGERWGSSTSLSTANGPFQVYLSASNGGVLTVDKIVTINGDQPNLAYLLGPGRGTTALDLGDTGIELSLNNQAANSYLRVEKITGMAPNLPTHSVGYYWSIEGLANRTFQADLTFSYSEATLAGWLESSLELYHSHNGGLTWSLVPTTLDTVANQLTAQGISQFSLWALGANSAPAAAQAGWSLYQ
jgi:hypothetical protein